MASIYKRNGKWRVEIRKIGSKGIHKSFIVKDEAIRFARETEVKIEQGLYLDLTLAKTAKPKYKAIGEPIRRDDDTRNWVYDLPGEDKKYY